MPKILGLDKKWWQTIGFALVIFAIITIYNSIGIYSFNIISINKSLADLAFILVCLSMLMASFSYLFKRGQKYIAYRMHLGVTGFFAGLIHVIIADYFYFFAKNPPYPNFEFGHMWPFPGGIIVPNSLAFVCGILAILIFAFMALITLKYFLLKLGGVLWRKLLRYLGFSALALVLIHFLIKNLDVWLTPSEWGALPPFTIFLWIFGLKVLVLRLVLWYKLRAAKAKKI